MSDTRRILGASLLALCGCSSLATSPAWVGGGMAVTGPLRIEREEAAMLAEYERVASQPDEIGARHILVMHAKSQAKPDAITRSRDEALARAGEALAKLKAGASFSDMVSAYTDEPGGKERGGDLGVFRRDVMVKRFADAAFSLKVGEVSDIVETEYGFHVIKRTR